MKVISFSSIKGGVGRTTIVAQLAIALVRRKQRVLAIDLDPQNLLGILLGADPSDDSGIVREGLHRGILFDSPLIHGHSSEIGPQFVPFGRVLTEDRKEFADELIADRNWLSDRLRALQGLGFDFVLIDTPAGVDEFAEQAIRVADQRVVVCATSTGSWNTLPRSLAFAREDGRSDDSNSILVNGYNPRDLISIEIMQAIRAEYPQLVLPTHIHADVKVGESLAAEEALHQFAPQSVALQDYGHLADWLIARLKN